MGIKSGPGTPTKVFISYYLTTEDLQVEGQNSSYSFTSVGKTLSKEGTTRGDFLVIIGVVKYRFTVVSKPSVLPTDM